MWNLRQEAQTLHKTRRTVSSIYWMGYQTDSWSTAYANGDEYEILLRYSNDEAAKLAHGSDDDEDEDEDEYSRPWYAPWRKVHKQSTKEKKVYIAAYGESHESRADSSVLRFRQSGCRPTSGRGWLMET